MKLKYYRKLSGISAQDAAAAIGVKVQAFYKYESGDALPSINSFLLLAKLYKVDPYELADMELGSVLLLPAPQLNVDILALKEDIKKILSILEDEKC
jgi:transcriptional regulator with XRE-family HTH domain